MFYLLQDGCTQIAFKWQARPRLATWAEGLRCCCASGLRSTVPEQARNDSQGCVRLKKTLYCKHSRNFSHSDSCYSFPAPLCHPVLIVLKVTGQGWPLTLHSHRPEPTLANKKHLCLRGSALSVCFTLWASGPHVGDTARPLQKRALRSDPAQPSLGLPSFQPASKLFVVGL